MDRASIIELGELLFGLDNDYKETANGVLLGCPFAPYSKAHAHNVDKKPGFSINADDYGNSQCHCFTCKEGGSLLGIIRKLNTLANGEYDNVEEFVKEQEDADLAVLIDNMEKRVAAKKVATKKTASEIELNQFVIQAVRQKSKYLLERGLTSKELEKWYLGYDKSSQRVTFPVFNQEGALVAVYGRITKGKGIKYLLYTKFSAAIDGYFYGEQFLDVTWDSPIILVEGMLDAIILSRYFRNVLCCFGTTVTAARKRKLKQWNLPVVFMFDGDGAGRESAVKGAELLSPILSNVFIARLPDDKDPADCEELVVKKAYEEKLLFMGLFS